MKGFSLPGLQDQPCVRKMILLALLSAVTIGGARLASPSDAGAALHFRPELLACRSALPQLAASMGCKEATAGTPRRAEAQPIALLSSYRAIFLVGGDEGALSMLRLRGGGKVGHDPPQGSLLAGGCLAAGPFVPHCQTLPGAYSDAPPIDGPTGAAISEDGKTLYAVSGEGSATIATFATNPARGTLRFVGCLTGSAESTSETTPAEEISPCEKLPGATGDGTGSALGGASGVVEGDGLVLVTTEEGEVAVFSRNLDGRLELRECLGGPPSTGCRQLGAHGPEALADPIMGDQGAYLYASDPRSGAIFEYRVGEDEDPEAPIRLTGCVGNGHCRGGGQPLPADLLNDVEGLATEEPGQSLLFATSGYGSVVSFHVHGRSGALSLSGCVSDRPSLRGTCSTVVWPHGKHTRPPLVGVGSPVTLRESPWFVVGAPLLDGVSELGYNPATGKLAYRGCATSDLALSISEGGRCFALPGATANGVGSAFYEARLLAPGPRPGLFYVQSTGFATTTLLRP